MAIPAKPSVARLRALDAVRVLARESYHVSPRRVGLLVSGLLLVCCWRFLAASVAAFDSLGLQCLLQMWATAVVACTLGQTAKWLYKQQHTAASDDETLSDILSEDSSSFSSTSSGLQQQLHPLKEGVELSMPQHGTAAAAERRSLQHAGQFEQQEEEDMTMVKRRAQEEAAARLARYRTVLQQRLASMRQAACSSSSNNSSSGIDAQLLYGLADELFASPMNLSVFVELGGVPVVLEALKAVTNSLQQALQHQQQEQQRQQPQEQRDVLTGSLPALLQVSWVLLQVAQGPAACRAELQCPECSAALLAAAQAAAALPPTAARATESTLRNLWWTLLSLCDTEPAAAAASSLSSSNRSGSAAAAAQPSHAGSTNGCASFQQQLLQQYQDTGAVQQLQQLLSLKHGYSAGWVATAHLGLLVQLGHHQQQQEGVCLQQGGNGTSQQQQMQQQQQPQQQLLMQQVSDLGVGSNGVLSVLASSAVHAVLQEDSMLGLCCLMVHMRLEQRPADAAAAQQQLCGRMRSLVEGVLHYLLTFHAPQLLQLLIEQQLVGCFVRHSCTRLARLLVCQLLSSTGQRVLAAVEEGYELDVPLALAQVIPLQIHVKLPESTAAVEESSPACAGAAAGHGSAAVQSADGPQQQDQQQQQPVQPGDDLYTDMLACRLLLQHQRLWELLTVLCEDARSTTQQQPQQQLEQQGAEGAQQGKQALAAAADAVDWECSVVAAGLGLVQHLMSRDLQLQEPRHMRGDCVSDSMSGSSSSRSLQEVLALPDHTGAYGRMLEGMVAQEPPCAAVAATGASAAAGGAGVTATSGVAGAGVVESKQGSSGNGDLLPLPVSQQPPVVAQASASGVASMRAPAARQVVFQFGQLQHAVDAATFKQIRDSSSLVRSILGRVSATGQQQEPITVLAIPKFTHEANCWVLQCLERWLHSGVLTGFSVTHAARLWVAADFLQVDELQAACEEVITAGFQEDPQHSMPLALELCAHHTDSGSRLLKLLVQQLLRQLCSAPNSSATAQQGSSGSAGTASSQARQQLQLLGQLLQHHEGLLLPAMHAELRDRLVTLCMLHAGAGDEDSDGVLA